MTTIPGLSPDVIREAVEGIDAINCSPAYLADYSGRGMNGRTCPAVSVDSIGGLIALGASIAYVIACNADDLDDATEAIDDVAVTLARAQIDSLGRGYVAYWPHLGGRS